MTPVSVTLSRSTTQPKRQRRRSASLPALARRGRGANAAALTACSWRKRLRLKRSSPVSTALGAASAELPSLFWFAFLAGPHVPTGANMTCTAIWTALVHAKAFGVVIPRVLYLQIDGGSENWNLVTFAFFSWLVTVGIFDHVQLRRLQPGCVRARA